MLRASLLISAVSSLLFAPAADAMIQLDRAISGARLGNTKGEVRAALGKPRRVIHRAGEFGPTTQFRYRGGLRVIFLSGRVTLAGTTGLGDRTGGAWASARRAGGQGQGRRCHMRDVRGDADLQPRSRAAGRARHVLLHRAGQGHARRRRDPDRLAAQVSRPRRRSGCHDADHEIHARAGGHLRLPRPHSSPVERHRGRKGRARRARTRRSRRSPSARASSARAR